MSRRSITDIAVGQLERLFRPRGLPLVEKGAPAPTTSVLIRGDAGAGKTTLAAALAQAISRDGEGFSIYLTTETIATDLVFKAERLGLGVGAVLPWKARAQATVGATVVQHLALVGVGDESPEDSPDRLRAALNAVWELKETTEDNGVPLRVVAIDAFGPSELRRGAESKRPEIVEHIQALEGEGISVILVEEAGGERSDWLPFAVDTVLELGWEREEGGGQLTRKLSVPKCRYAAALVGPHDYGLEDERPAVWPDLLAVVAHGTAADLVVEPLPTAVLVHGLGWVASRTGAIFATQIPNGMFGRQLVHTTGARPAECRLGLISTFRAGESGSLPISDGPNRVVWWVLTQLTHGQDNLLLLELEREALERPRFSRTLLNGLEAFRALGLVTLLIDPQGVVASAYTSCEAIEATKPFGPAVHRGRAREDVQLPGQRLVSATRLLYRSEEDLSSIPLVHDQGVAKALEALVQARESSSKRKAPSRAQTEQWRRLSDTHAASSVRMFVASELSRWGCLDTSREILNGVSDRDIGLDLRSVWLRASLGDLRWASHQALKDRGGLPKDTLLWSAIVALLTGSKRGLEILEEAANRRQGEVLPLFLQVLSFGGHYEALDRYLSTMAQSTPSTEWVLTRIRWEARLFGTDEDFRRATSELKAILEKPELPDTHRGEVLHNLGAAFEARSIVEMAVLYYRQALEHHPLLEPTRARLVALGVPPPPEPPE